MDFEGLDKAKHIVKQSPFWPWVCQRRVHAYCVGAPKTGTHFLAGLFTDEFRAAHEPTFLENVRYIKKRKQGIQKSQVRDFLWKRDRWLWLDIESSHLIAHFSDVLVDTFPESRYILPVRRPRSWLNSIMNQHLKVDLQPGSLPDQLRDLYHQVDRDYKQGEEVLEAHDLYTLDGYLAYWKMHNRMVLDAIPRERLLVLDTESLSDSVSNIADFLEVSANRLNVENDQRYEGKRKKDLVSRVDEGLLEHKIDEYCAGLIDRLTGE